jgi:hypothetical protein
MREISAGPEVVDVLTLCHSADTPVILFGETGVGKSQLINAAAAAIDGECVALNTPIIDPLDLGGLPVIADGATTFAAPARLPRSGRGFLFLDEIGRANPSLQAAVLQLLTERRLNDYTLPPSFLPVAATNVGDGYQVGDLDPALLSRFVCIRVVPSITSFLAWAGTAGIHPAVLDFASLHSDLFRARRSNPRAWEMVSKILCAATPATSMAAIEVAIAGLVDDWAPAFLNHLRGTERVVPPLQIVDGYPDVRPQVLGWMSAKRIDTLHATFAALLQHLGGVDTNALSTRQLGHITAFINDLPADFREMWAEWLEDRGWSLPRARRSRRA